MHPRENDVVKNDSNEDTYATVTGKISVHLLYDNEGEFYIYVLVIKGRFETRSIDVVLVEKCMVTS